MKRLNELKEYKNSNAPIPPWINPTTANTLNMKQINESVWLEQNLYRTWENWPRQSKWAIPEASKDEFLIEKTPMYSQQIDQSYFKQDNKSHYTTLRRQKHRYINCIGVYMN